MPSFSSSGAPAMGMRSRSNDYGAETEYDANIKLLLMGDSGVGKTCLMLQYADHTFSITFITTVGIDYKYKFMQLGDEKVRLEIWDTAGQERFKAITTSYLRGAQGIMLVYDVTDRKSFDHVTVWLDQISQYADVNVEKILVGNKVDVPGKRVVSVDEGHALASKHGLAFFETSAKSNVGVDEAFYAIAKQVHDRVELQDASRSKGDISLEAAPVATSRTKRGGCC